VLYEDTFPLPLDHAQSAPEILKYGSELAMNKKYQLFFNLLKSTPRNLVHLFSLKLPNGTTFASDSFVQAAETGLDSLRYSSALLPAHCLRAQGKYLLDVAMPLAIDADAATAHAQLRVFVNGKLMHAGRHHHPFLGLTHLSPGTHELELKAVGEHMSPLQTSFAGNLNTGFRRTLTVIGSETGTGANVSCEFPGDLTETLVLNAAGEASYDVARQNMSVESNTIQIIHPLEGGCLPSKGRLRLSLQYPSSVRSSPGAEDAMVLLIVDGSAVRIPLGARLASCFDVDSENMRSLTVDRLYDDTFEPKHHTLKVSVVTKDWNTLAKSLPVVLVEQGELGNCRETLHPRQVGAGTKKGV
jgi:hypothetical protein